MNNLRWFNHSLPQTLQIGLILLYVNAVFLVLGGGVFHPLFLLLTAGFVAGGLGIANEKKWGYGIGLTAAVVQVLLLVAVYGLADLFAEAGLLIGFMFDAALVALLAHPESRNYQRIWFS